MSEQPLIENQQANVEALAQQFRDMAARLVLNGDKNFGGAFVVVPPAAGEPIHTLILDGNQDPAQFWAILKTKAEMALAGLDEQMRNQTAFRR